ncbi:MAG: replicative DNA helicase, partial [Parachlamydiales bacterium]
MTGDSVIQDAVTGKLYTIKELAERQVQTPIFVHAVDENLKMGKHRMIKAFYSGKKKTFMLTTRTGRSIKASANHPFLKFGEWTPLEKLLVGDKIAIPRELTLSTPSNSMKKDELILLAHLVGDGCVLPTQPYHYTSADPENREVVSASAQRLVDIQPRLVHQENW